MAPYRIAPPAGFLSLVPNTSNSSYPRAQDACAPRSYSDTTSKIAPPMDFLALVPNVSSDSYAGATTTSSSGIAPHPMVADFLALAPNVSDSYPRGPYAAVEGTTKRRSSSLGDSSGLRYLKLGPVHYGEHPGEDKADFHEVEI